MLNNEFKKGTPIFWSWGVFLFVLLVVIDQLSKYLARDIFRNYVFAFSLHVPEPLIYLIYAIVLVAMIYYLKKNHHKFSMSDRLAWLLIFAGAISNIGERVFLGYVRDFIYITFYKWTGIYNLADGYILLGIAILFIESWFITKKESGSKN